MDWISLVPERGRWPALINKVIQGRVLY